SVNKHSPTFLYYFFPSMTPPPPRSTLFPYTTLFRSHVRIYPAPVKYPIINPVPNAEQAAFFLCGSGELDYPAEGVRLVIRHSLRSEEHTSELQSLAYLVCRLLLEKKKNKIMTRDYSR